MMNYLPVDLRAEDTVDFDSDSVDVVGYDRQTKTLYVEFQSSCNVYSYVGVEESTYNMLVNADSVGTFVAKYIKDNGYGGEKYDENYYITLREKVPGYVDPATTTAAEAFPATVQSGVQVKDEDSEFFVPASRIAAPTARFGVRWSLPGTALGAEPVYEAASVEEALKQFGKEAEAFFGPGVEVHVKAVVHYFD